MTIDFTKLQSAGNDFILIEATGMDMDEAGLKKIARRNRILLRAVNVSRGMRREDEKPPEDHWHRRFPELETQLLDEYYMFKGWNSQGIPTAETLRELDLGFIADDFIKRGILTEKEEKTETGDKK